MEEHILCLIQNCQIIIRANHHCGIQFSIESLIFDNHIKIQAFPAFYSHNYAVCIPIMLALIDSRAEEDLYRSLFESECDNECKGKGYEILLKYQALIIFVNCQGLRDNMQQMYGAKTKNSFLNHASLVDIISPFDPPSVFFLIKQRDPLCKSAIHNRLTLYINFINQNQKIAQIKRELIQKVNSDLSLPDNFNNIIDMHINQSQRQRRLENVEKEFLTNYYLQKYNSIMSEISQHPQNLPPEQSKPNLIENRGQRLNFKSMMVSKKNQNNYNTRQSALQKQQSYNSQLSENKGLTHKYSSREEQQNQKTAKKLQESIINQLYRTSPSKLEQGNYKKIEFNSNYTPKNVGMNKNSIQIDSVPLETILVTYQEDSNDRLPAPQSSQDQNRLNRIRQGIKQEFQRRKQKSMSPNKQKLDESLAKSSKISVQIKIQSPKKLQRLNTPHKARVTSKSNSHRGKSRKKSQEEYDNKLNADEQVEYPKVYFERQGINQQYQGDKMEERQEVVEFVEQQINFLPPTSNQYQSNNLNLVQQSFKYQQQVRQYQKSSEKAKSLHSSRKSSQEKIFYRQESKKSLADEKKEDNRDSSKAQMSFVSKMSMLSSDQGLLVKERIQKQLYDNELGPYQSALFNIIQLIERYPKSGPVYAVGQKTLEDRKQFQFKRLIQQTQIADLRSKIQKIKRQTNAFEEKNDDQSIIKSNQLRIMKQIRKLSTML